jgi:AcrR family transcriptional regulator
MPKIVDHDQRRRELLQATATVIATEGIQAATVRRIALKAGCTTGLVTHYFAGKDELVIGALRHVHSAAADRMVARTKQTTGMDALRAVLMEALPISSAGQFEWRVWLSFWGMAWTSGPLSAEHRERYELWWRLINHLLRDTARLGQIPPGLDLREATDQLVALVDGLGLQVIYEPVRLTHRRVAAVIDAQLAEFTTRPPLLQAAGRSTGQPGMARCAHLSAPAAEAAPASARLAARKPRRCRAFAVTPFFSTSRHSRSCTRGSGSRSGRRIR